jgi:pilus assembly protein CpaB
LKRIAIKVFLGIHLLCGALVGASTEYAHVRQLRHLGLGLVPVVIATRPIKAGSTIDTSALKAVPIPEQFVTSSVVKPDSAHYLEGSKAVFDIDEGEPVGWGQVAPAKPTPDTLKNCQVRCTRAQKPPK